MHWLKCMDIDHASPFLRKDYVDFADKDDEWIQQQHSSIKLRGNDDLFPVALQRHLGSTTSSSHSSVIRWLDHGRAFKVYDRQRLVEEVLPKFFYSQKQYGSFQRQLSSYGFYQLTADHNDNGAYYHPFLLRHRPTLSKLIRPLSKARGSKRRTFDTSTEPKFDQAPPLASRCLSSPTKDESREAARVSKQSDPTYSNSGALLQHRDQARAFTTGLHCSNLDSSPDHDHISPLIPVDSHMAQEVFEPTAARVHTVYSETRYQDDSAGTLLHHRLYQLTGAMNHCAFPLQGTLRPEMTSSTNSRASSAALADEFAIQATAQSDQAMSLDEEQRVQLNRDHTERDPLICLHEYYVMGWHVSHAVPSSVELKVSSSSIESLADEGDLDASEPMGLETRMW
jgi:HSF-type DNA-binding